MPSGIFAPPAGRATHGNRRLTIRLASPRSAGASARDRNGTFRGGMARRLASVFPDVVTIELSKDLHRSAELALRDTPRVRGLQGHSAQRLGQFTDPAIPTLYYLDGHWSGGTTGGAGDECPVLAELAAMGTGSPDDCVIVDDAHLFTSSPSPPHRSEQWPTLMEVIDAIRARHPSHLVTLLTTRSWPRRCRRAPRSTPTARACSRGRVCSATCGERSAGWG